MVGLAVALLGEDCRGGLGRLLVRSGQEQRNRVLDTGHSSLIPMAVSNTGVRKHRTPCS